MAPRAPTRFPPVIAEDLPRIAERIAPHAAELAGRRLLITGAGGMLPAYLADSIAFLNDSGAFASPCHLVLVVRSLERARVRLAHLGGRGDVRFVEHEGEPLPKRLHFDYLVHAGAPSGPREFLADPLSSLDANVVVLRAWLRAARDAKSALYVSSSEVYGTPDADAIPTPETYVGRVDPLAQRAYYAEAKRAGETYCRAFFETHKLPIKIARPFHVHGPGLRRDDRRIVPALMSMVRAGKRIELESDGSATRTYGYVADAAVALLRILLSSHEGEAFNVGSDRPEISVLELAELVRELAGQSQPVKHGPPNRNGAPARARPDIDKLRRAFAFEPEVELREGLSRTLRWAAAT